MAQKRTITEVRLYPRKAPKQAKVKRKAPKRQSVMRSLRNKLWELSKAITRARYGGNCYTCNKIGLTGVKQQTGHFIPRSIGGLLLRYELRNLRVQCYNCNINLGGNGAVFYRNLVRDEGQEYVDRLFSEKLILTKETKDFYFDKIAEYKKLLESV